MKLVIAEKPSVAMSLAAVLGANEKKDGYMEGGGYLVSWWAHDHGRDGVQEEVRRGQGCRMAGLPQALQDRWQPQLSRDAALRQSGQSVRCRLRRARLRLCRGNSAQADRGAGTESVKAYNNDQAPLEACLEGSFCMQKNCESEEA